MKKFTSPLSEFDFKEMNKNIIFKGNTINCISVDSEDISNFFKHIDSFCAFHGISTKYIGEGITVYPKDRDLIDGSKVGNRPTYFQVIFWTLDNDDKYERIEFDFDESDEEYTDVNSLEDLENALLMVHNLDYSEFHFTQEEIDLQNAKKLLNSHKISVQREKEVLFENALKAYRVTYAEFLDIFALYTLPISPLDEDSLNSRFGKDAVEFKEAFRLVESKEIEENVKKAEAFKASLKTLRLNLDEFLELSSLYEEFQSL